MKLSEQGLRKAAILVASLDTAAADAVLDQLSPEQAQRVRLLVVDLGDVDDREQQRVIDEFFRVGPMIPPPSPAGIELDGRLAQTFFRQGSFESAEPSEVVPQGGSPFQFLHEAQADKLAQVLAGERPQTIALVLSHLPAARAGAVLARLPDGSQVDVIRRLVDLEETDPEILREVEAVLRTRLAEPVPIQRRRVAGLEAVAGILAATDTGAGGRILENLAAHDRSLAEKLSPQALEFDDLAELDSETLAEIFATAGHGLAVPALFGAQADLVQRVIRSLPAGEAKALGEELRHPGPLRLGDVGEARRRIVNLARPLMFRTTKAA